MRHHSGFTLIEAMIVVAIIAILAAVAVPSYSEYAQRAKITDATSALSAQRIKMEQYFQDNRTYVGACAPGTVAPMPSVNNGKNFTFTCPGPTATTYTVLASGTAGSNMAEFSYSVNQANTRLTVSLPTGWNTNPANCWVTKKDGSC
jgi:type IV pilus assembly protein PilE